MDRVLHCVRHKIPAFISVDGKSGRGKTTVAEFLAYYLRAHDFVVQTAASTGQAALNHPLGCRAHSLFGLPLDDGPQISSNVSPNSDRAKLLRETHLFQWDEWPNSKCQCWDAAVGLVEELMGKDAGRGGGKVFVCYGDFRQIPPVQRHASRAQVRNLSVQQSPTWPHFEVFRLLTPQRDGEDKPFSRWIDDIGDGKADASNVLNGEKGYVRLEYGTELTDVREAIRKTFPNLGAPHACAKRKILTTTNAAADEINAEIFDKLVEVHGLQEEMRHSADKIAMDEHGDLDKSVTTDFLHAQNEPGCPPHTLRIVKGALYELTRNFSAAERLMNRTKVIVRDTKTHHLVVETLDGRVFPLPRILFHWQIGRGVVTMSRRQFPLRPAYASTFNGAQGETLQTATVDIRQSPFLHGQL